MQGVSDPREPVMEAPAILPSSPGPPLALQGHLQVSGLCTLILEWVLKA